MFLDVILGNNLSACLVGFGALSAEVILARNRWVCFYNNMVSTATWIIGVLCLIVAVLWVVKPSWRGFVKMHSPVLNVLTALVALTAFIQINLSVEQFEQSQKEARQKERERFDARMATLMAEITGNVEVCDEILTRKDEALAARVLPVNRFHYDILQDMFVSGELTKHAVRGKLFTVYHKMLLANQVIETSLVLMCDKTLADSSQYPAIDERLGKNMTTLVKLSGDIKKLLRDLDGDLKEFWNDPEKYKESVYLRG